MIVSDSLSEAIPRADAASPSPLVVLISSDTVLCDALMWMFAEEGVKVQTAAGPSPYPWQFMAALTHIYAPQLVIMDLTEQDYDRMRQQPPSPLLSALPIGLLTDHPISLHWNPTPIGFVLRKPFAIDHLLAVAIPYLQAALDRPGDPVISAISRYYWSVTHAQWDQLDKLLTDDCLLQISLPPDTLCAACGKQAAISYLQRMSRLRALQRIAIYPVAAGWLTRYAAQCKPHDRFELGATRFLFRDDRITMLHDRLPLRIR
jgi:hypothetical protein